MTRPAAATAEETAGKSAGPLPWVHGFRPPNGDRWMERLADLVLGRTQNLDTGDSTREAERELGIAPSFYCYVGRSEGAFGWAILLFDVETERVRDDDRGICPFDTGGLWHQFIRCRTSLSNDERRALFAKHDRKLREWPTAVVEYLSANYGQVVDYITGKPPREPVEEFLPQPANSSRAWTWEGRARREQAMELLIAKELYWSADAKNRFLNWLEEDDCPLVPGERTWVAEWVVRAGIECPVGTSGSAAVREMLTDRYG